jgi:hypothetical protein
MPYGVTTNKPSPGGGIMAEGLGDANEWVSHHQAAIDAATRNQTTIG